MNETFSRRSVGPAVVLGVSLILIAAGLIAGCSGNSTGNATRGTSGGMAGMAPGEMNAYGYMAHPAVAAMSYSMPDHAMRAPEVQEAYTFAIEHPEVLTYLPCSCGCVQMGHLSNWNCYVRSVSSAGAVEFEQHASGCQVCVDITLDAKRMWQRGSPLTQIRSFVDAHYPGSMTQTELPAGA